MDITHLIRPEILRLKGYRSARSELSQETADVVWLDANENPWEPYPGKPKTTGYNRYPDPQPKSLLSEFAYLYGAPEESLLITRGSDEGIDLLMRIFCREGQDAVLTCTPTYGYYKVAAAIQGAEVIEVPFDKHYELDAEAVWKTVEENKNIKLVILCSPNNPTGNLLDRKKIVWLCEKLAGKAIVVVDEAYMEFVPKNEIQTLAGKASRTPNLVVLRTLSKAYALAGVRCGVTIGSPELIEVCRRVIAPYPVPVPTVKAVQKALSPEGVREMEQKVQLLTQERERMAKALKKHSEVIKFFHSDTNFLLIQTKDAGFFLRETSAYGLVLRDRSSDVPNCIRLTIGSPEENDRVLETLGLKPKDSQPSQAFHREAEVSRETAETKIRVWVNLDRSGSTEIKTGIGFFDHMLEQLARHGGFSMSLACEGDLQVDEHHSVEDCALALGEALRNALGDKKGIGRYGFLLPMDESLAQVAVDLSGRPVFRFEGTFPRNDIGGFPAEMIVHFFQSLADGLRMALHIQVKGENAHHMAEACFKGVGRALRMAFEKEGNELPSTKGML